MIVSIVILAASVAVTAVFTLRARQDAAIPDGPSMSEQQSAAPSPESPSSGKPQTSAPGSQQTPDWMADEEALDELAEQFLASGHGEDVPDAPDGPDVPQASPEPSSDPSPEPSAPREPCVKPFSAVKEGDYFYAPLMWAAQRGIVSGDSFSPGSVCSRAQAITFLWRQQGEPEPKLAVSPFSDVTEKEYFYKPVLWAFENGLVSTPSDGKFKPGDAVNRAQVMTFLYRVSGGSADGLSNPFSNVGPRDYYHDSALWAYSRGIVILDDGETEFDATSPCSRAQYITFLYRCFGPDAQGGQ